MTQPVRVLLVEDDFLIRACLADYLEERGISVQEAGSVAEARAEIETGGRIDVLLVDMNLPDGLGTEVTALLRARAPALPVIHVSGAPAGDSADGPGEEGTRAGSGRDRWLSKPYSLAAVLSALEEMTGRRMGDDA